MTSRQSMFSLYPVVLGAFLAAYSSNASAGNYSPPSMDGFKLHTERDADGDEDGVKETRIKQYLNTKGDSLVSMTTRGTIWAWSLNTRGSEVGDKNYVIRDSNCDGSFDEVYGLDQEFHLPDCLKALPSKP